MDRHLLVGGGLAFDKNYMSHVLSDAYAYSPFTNQWTQCSSMQTACHSAVSGVIQGRLYALGGRNTQYNKQPESALISTTTSNTL